jgi:hypothetical protein
MTTTYLVRAKPKRDLMVQLDKRLQSGKISQITPFGKVFSMVAECIDR